MRLLLFTVSLGALSCGGLFTGVRPSTTSSSNAVAAQVEAQRVTALSRAASDAAEAQCAPFEKRAVPWAEEQRVGHAFAANLLRTNRPYLDDGGPRTQLTQRVAVVGRVLARRSSRPDISWTFGIVESETPFARGLPGGHVFVSSALLKNLRNEAELAGVLAHEIGHVTARDPLEQYERAVFLQCTAATFVAELAKNGVAPSQAQRQMIEFAERFKHFDLEAADPTFEHFLFDTVFTLSQTRGPDEEFKADRTALQLLGFAGYDPVQYEVLLLTVEFNGGGTAPVADRAAKLKALREGEFAPFATGTAKPEFKFAP